MRRPPGFLTSSSGLDYRSGLRVFGCGELANRTDSSPANGAARLGLLAGTMINAQARQASQGLDSVNRAAGISDFVATRGRVSHVHQLLVFLATLAPWRETLKIPS
jgi:hypothetical protein